MTNFDATTLLEEKNLRVTRPRVLIANLLFADRKNRHVSAEWIGEQLRVNGESIALASVYNTLHNFVSTGLLSEVHGADKNVTIFDTNTAPHYHVYNERTGELKDINRDDLQVIGEPKLSDNEGIIGFDIIVRVR